MLERIYLISDRRFWGMLIEENFKAPPAFFAKNWAELYKDHPLIEIGISVFFCVASFAFLLTATLLYYLTPAFYFYKVLFLAIYTETIDNMKKAWHKQWDCRRYNVFLSAICFVHGVIIYFSCVSPLFDCSCDVLLLPSG